MQDGYGQERVSFHTVKQPCVATSTPTVTAKLSASLKRISPKSPVQDGSSSSDDTESDEQKPQVFHHSCIRATESCLTMLKFVHKYDVGGKFILKSISSMNHNTSNFL
jgi:hypothetical protein